MNSGITPDASEARTDGASGAIFHHALPPANEGRGDDRRPRSEPEYLGIARTVPPALGGKEGAVGRRGRARRYRAVHSSPRCGVPVQYQSLFSARSLPESEKSVGRLDGGIPNPSRALRGVRWPGRPVRPRSGPLAPGIVGIRRLGSSDVLDRSVRQPISRPRVDEETIRLPLCPRTVLARGQTKIRVLCPPDPLGGAVHRPAGPSDGPEGRQARDQFGPRGTGRSPGQGGRLEGRGDDRAPGRFSRGEGDRLLRSRPFRLEELSPLRRASGGKAIRCEGLRSPGTTPWPLTSQSRRRSSTESCRSASWGPSTRDESDPSGSDWRSGRRRND